MQMICSASRHVLKAHRLDCFVDLITVGSNEVRADLSALMDFSDLNVIL